MDRRGLALGLVVVLLGAAAGVVALGLVPPAGDEGGPAATPTGTPTVTEGPRTTTGPPPLALSIVAVESCGQTCRDVTARLVNNQETAATGVTVSTRIHAGTDTDGDVVWEGEVTVGTLDPGEAVRETQRVELGLMDAAAVQAADGEVTIVTTIETDRRTLQVVERRDVS